MKIRINKKHLNQGCIFTFNHTCFNGKKESIILKIINNEIDNTIILYHINFSTKWGCYDRLFNTYHDARKWITEQTKTW